MKTLRVTIDHLDEISTLFDKYRQFYEQAADYEGCRDYLRHRIENDESVIFLSLNESDEPIGFTQLYKSFCSVELRRIIYLYDLYVDPSARRAGVAKTLMETAKEYAKSCGAANLTLETGVENFNAQRLYESLGYKRDEAFFTYHLAL